MTYGPPPFVDMPTLCYCICSTEDEVLRMVNSGTLPKPEKHSKGQPLWRWSQINNAMKGDCRRVYFIEAGEFIKIGYSSNVGKRMDELSTGCPHDFKLLHDTPGDRELEADMHKRFRHLRARQEWFRKDPELLAYIKDLKTSRR